MFGLWEGFGEYKMGSLIVKQLTPLTPHHYLCHLLRKFVLRFY